MSARDLQSRVSSLPSSSGGPRPNLNAIQAPWRLEHLESLSAGERSSRPGSEPGSTGSGSFLLDYWRSPADDERNHVIVRDAFGMILLNKYPYAAGHLLVALGEPRPTLLEYSEAELVPLWALVRRGAELMQRVLQPQGINIGINQGRAAGASVPQHVHVHLVPRWGGDVTFMETVGQVRVIPASLEMMARRYRAALGAALAAGRGVE